MFKVKLSKQSVKFLKRLKEPQYSSIKDCLNILAKWPVENKDIIAMKGIYSSIFVVPHSHAE